MHIFITKIVNIKFDFLLGIVLKSYFCGLGHRYPPLKAILFEPNNIIMDGKVLSLDI